MASRWCRRDGRHRRNTPMAILQLDEACELYEDDDVAARLPDNDDGYFEWREA